MNRKLICCLAIVLSGALGGCSKTPSGKLYEIHSLQGQPSLAVYMHGFVDSSFDAYIKEGAVTKLLFRSLPALESQFANTTNSITGENHAKRIPEENVGLPMYDVFWSTNLQRVAIAFQGNFVAAYDCQTRQKIQIAEWEDETQRTALGAVIKRFLDEETVTDAEVAEVRRHSYSEH